MTTYTNITKPAGTSYTNTNAIGKQQYDQSTLTYDDSSTYYDGVNPNLYTNVTRPSFYNPVAYWSLDGNANDSIGNNNGVVTGATYVAGKINQALDFNGTTDYVTIPDSTSLSLEVNNAFTFSTWFYLDSYNNNVLPRILEKRSDYITIMGNSGNSKYRKLGMEVAASADNGNGNNGVSEFWGSTQLNTGQWYHMVCTFDGNLVGNEPSVYQGKFYLNGVAETMDTIFNWSGTLQSTTGYDLYFARRRTDLLRNLDGKLDEVKFWNTALTATQAVALYNPTSFYTKVSKPT